MTIAVNVFYAKNEKIYPAYISKHNSNYSFNDFKRRKAMVLSCSKKLSALLRTTTSKYHGNFYCLNCLHSFEIERKLESYKRVCK